MNRSAQTCPGTPPLRSSGSDLDRCRARRLCSCRSCPVSKVHKKTVILSERGPRRLSGVPKERFCSLGWSVGVVSRRICFCFSSNFGNRPWSGVAALPGAPSLRVFSRARVGWQPPATFRRTSPKDEMRTANRIPPTNPTSSPPSPRTAPARSCHRLASLSAPHRPRFARPPYAPRPSPHPAALLPPPDCACWPAAACARAA